MIIMISIIINDNVNRINIYENISGNNEQAQAEKRRRGREERERQKRSHAEEVKKTDRQ